MSSKPHLNHHSSYPIILHHQLLQSHLYLSPNSAGLLRQLHLASFTLAMHLVREGWKRVSNLWPATLLHLCRGFCVILLTPWLYFNYPFLCDNNSTLSHLYLSPNSAGLLRQLHLASFTLAMHLVREGWKRVSNLWPATLVHPIYLVVSVWFFSHHDFTSAIHFRVNSSLPHLPLIIIIYSEHPSLFCTIIMNWS